AITQLTIRAPMSGHVIRKYQVEGEYVEEGARLYDVVDLSTVWVQAQVYEDELALLQKGMAVSATTLAYPNRTFAGTLSFIHPHLDQSTRTLTVRFDMDNPEHELRPGMYATIKLQVPVARLDATNQAWMDEWRTRLAADLALHAADPGSGPLAAGGIEPLLHMGLQSALLSRGLVLAVPDGSVIDTGSRKVVYRQETPGVYEGVEVRLGPRMLAPDGVAFYPVLHGLEAGEEVVTNGSFLIDAETRLNPAAGSIYYGGSGGTKGGSASVASMRPTTPADEDQEIK